MSYSVRSKNALYLAVLGIFGFQALPAFATPVVIQNGYVKAGVSDYGTLGSDGSTSPGILYDSTGSGSYGINDFLTPGDPFEGFYVTTASGLGNGGANNDGVSGFGFKSPISLSPTSASWSGANSVFNITNTYTLSTFGGQSVIAINTVLTNASTSALTGVEFLRTLDPDPDVNAWGVYNTNNVVLSNNQSCGTGTHSGQTICIYSYDATTHNAGVSSSWSTDPAVYLAGVNSGNGDYAIGMGFNIGNLGAGQSINLSYGYALGATEAAASGGGTVPEPATLALLGLGLAGLGFSSRKRAD